MKDYIQIRKVKAEPMTRGEYKNYMGWTSENDLNSSDTEKGYLCTFEDGRQKWMPEEEFEESFLEWDGSMDYLHRIIVGHAQRFKSKR